MMRRAYSHTHVAGESGGQSKMCDEGGSKGELWKRREEIHIEKEENNNSKCVICCSIIVRRRRWWREEINNKKTRKKNCVVGRQAGDSVDIQKMEWDWSNNFHCGAPLSWSKQRNARQGKARHGELLLHATCRWRSNIGCSRPSPRRGSAESCTWDWTCFDLMFFFWTFFCLNFLMSGPWFLAWSSMVLLCCIICAWLAHLGYCEWFDLFWEFWWWLARKHVVKRVWGKWPWFG